MMKAYQKSKLDDAQYLLGDYFNIAINGYFLTPERAYKRLVISKYGELISKGNSAVIFGKTGYELFYDVMLKTSKNFKIKKQLTLDNNTKEFWGGWALSYLQWTTSRTFDNLYENLPFKQLIEMYYPYHEMDRRKFVEDINEHFLKKETSLKRLRKRNGFTQSELATKTNIGLRTIQMIEQKRNDISQTKVTNLYKFSKVLNCEMEDLLD